MRSEKTPQEENYLEYLYNATSSELKNKINDARVLTAKLGNILKNKKRKTIRDELHRLERKNLKEQKKKEQLLVLLI